MHRHPNQRRRRRLQRQTSAMIFGFNPLTVLGAIPFHFCFGCLLHIFTRTSALVSTIYLAHIHRQTHICAVFLLLLRLLLLSNEDFQCWLRLFVSPNSKEILRTHCLLLGVGCIYFPFGFFFHSTCGIWARAHAKPRNACLSTVARWQSYENWPIDVKKVPLRDNATRTSVPKKYAEKVYILIKSIKWKWTHYYYYH